MNKTIRNANLLSSFNIECEDALGEPFIESFYTLMYKWHLMSFSSLVLEGEVNTSVM